MGFRAANTADYPAIRDLIRSEQELFLVYPEGSYPMTVEQVAKLVRKREAPTVLVGKGKVIGFACFYGYRAGKSVYVGNLVIDSRNRGRGLGRKITVHMINKAFDDYELPEVRIAVFSTNTRALLLYSGLGFRPYRIAERADLHGNPAALIHMRLRPGQLVTS